MGLVEALEEESSATIPGPECSIAVFLASLDDADRDQLSEAVLRTTTIKTSVLHRAIKREFNVYVSVSSLSRHRAGICKCARKS